MDLLRTYTLVNILISNTFAILTDLDLPPLDIDLEVSMAKLLQESMDTLLERDVDNMIPTENEKVLSLKEEEIDKLFKLSEDNSPAYKSIFGFDSNILPESNKETHKVIPTRRKIDVKQEAKRDLIKKKGMLVPVKPKSEKYARKPPLRAKVLNKPVSSKIPPNIQRQVAIQAPITAPLAAGGGMCCYSMQCYNPCPYNMFPYHAVPVPDPVVVPGRAFYEPVIHDHPPIDKIRRIIANDKKRHKKRRYSSEDYSYDSSAGFSSQEYYDDFLNIRAPGY